MGAYYNENDPYAAQWLRNLIGAGHIATGDVDERSIVDVRADDVREYTQCHWFAGVGGWSLALRLAGWPDDRFVWSGSCPCQPFSAAGKGAAADDERHLWPAWFPLIAKCRPAIVFGEQVEAAIGWGWLDAVFSDLEGEGYACGAAVLPACGVGAPHLRQRCWFVAHADGRASGEPGKLEQSEGDRIPEISRQGARLGLAGDRGATRSLANAERDGGRPDQQERETQRRVSDGWAGAEWIECVDGKARPVEPGTFPLAHGIPGRMGRLRGYGNAIVPQVAAEFIAAADEAIMSQKP